MVRGDGPGNPARRMRGTDVPLPPAIAPVTDSPRPAAPEPGMGGDSSVYRWESRATP